jgi:hypothetical protein
MVTSVTVLDSLGATQTVNTLPPLSRAAAAASLPLALSNEDNTNVTAIVTAAGTPADVAWTTGSGTQTALLKAIAAAAISTTPQFVKGNGTAGAPDTAVLTMQGITAGTPLATTASTVGFNVATTITRPANVTAYTANNVVFGALDLGVLGPSASSVMLTSVQLELDIAAIPAGMTTFQLHLYNVTPPSALGNAVAFALPSGDRASYLGFVPIATPVAFTNTLYIESNIINKQVLLAGTHLFAYLVTVGPFTPAAVSEVYKATLHTVSL